MFLASFDYVINDLRKKQKQFMIGVMTIFLVVGFVTFLDTIVQISPAAIMLTVQTTNGDSDLKIGARGKAEQAVLSNTNFFTQDMNMFDFTQNSEQDGAALDSGAAAGGGVELPFVNFNEINEQIKDDENYAGAYPRWIALSKAINPKNRKKQTSAISVVGVSTTTTTTRCQNFTMHNMT